MKRKPLRKKVLLRKKKEVVFPLKNIVVVGLITLCVVPLLLVFGTIIVMAVDLPPADQLGKMVVEENNKTTTKFYDRTGKELLFEYGDIRRLPVKIDDIPDSVKNSTIAVEDWEFYDHAGITLRGMLRPIEGILSGDRTLAGGSTITQQLVRNTILDNRSRTATRKIKEILLALELEQQWTKDQILTAYLNYNPYGGNIYGIETAAQYYFGISRLKDITLAQAALLAGIPNSPYYYSPNKRFYTTTTEEVLRWIEASPEKQWVTVENSEKKIPSWKKRQAKILLDMVEHNYITRDDAVKALQEKLTFQKPVAIKRAPHFVDYVEGKLIDRYTDEFNGDQQMAEDFVHTQGLVITTTLDLDKQATAEQILKGEQGRLAQYNASNASIVALNPKSAEILVMAGSIDYWDEEIDGQVNVTTSKSRQPGSAVKPLVYARAFEQGSGTGSMLIDVPTIFDMGYDPKNYDGKFHGPLAIRDALANSYNIPAVKQTLINGVSDTIDFYHRMGITTLENPAKYGPAVGLGGAEISQLDLAYAFSVFANEGKMVGETATNKNNKIANYRSFDPVSILSITDSQGKNLYTYKPIDGKQVVDKGIAYMVSSILSDNKARIPAFGASNKLQLSSRTAAVKTGTTNDLKDITTFGYTPQLVAGVWVGNSSGAPMKNIAGSLGAAPIWNAFMTKALDGVPQAWYTQPSNVVAITVCEKTGLLPTDQCPTSSELYIRGKTPQKQDAFWKKYIVDKMTNKLAAEGCPVEYTEERSFLGGLQAELSKWQKAVDQWFSSSTDAQYKLPEEGVTACTPPFLGNSIAISILSPKDGAALAEGATTTHIVVMSKSPLSTVQFALDGKSFSTLPSQNSGKASEMLSEDFTAQLPTIPAGVHILSVTAVDQLGSSATERVTFISGNGAALTIAEPENGYATNNASITVSGKVLNSSSLQTLRYKVTQGDWVDLPIAPTYTFALSGLASGKYTITVQGNGDGGVIQETVDIAIDTEAPTATISLTGSKQAGQPVQFSCSASDTGSGVGKTEVVWGTVSTTLDKSLGVCANGKTISYTPTTAGDYFFALKVQDKAGNEKISQIVSATVTGEVVSE